MDKNEEKDIERELKEKVIETKIRSLEKELIELQRTKDLAWTAFCVGVTRMEKSLKEKILELSSNLKSTSCGHDWKEQGQTYCHACNAIEIVKSMDVKDE